MKKVILFGLFVFTISVINAQCTWDGGGGTNNWGDANNWGGDCDGAIPNVNDVVPTAGDAVVITGLPTTAGNVLTIDVNGDYTCGTLTLTGVGDNGGTLGAPRHTRVTVNVLAGNTLTPTGNVTITSGGATTPVAGIGDGFARLIVASTGTLECKAIACCFLRMELLPMLQIQNYRLMVQPKFQPSTYLAGM